MEVQSNKIVSVIIPTIAKEDYLKKCLESLRFQTHPAQEIIVIDTSLDTLFGQDVIQTYPFVKLYLNQERLSFSASLNKGISMSLGDFILCLNDDVVLEQNFIEEALRGFLLDAKVGMVSGKILRSDKVTLDSTGLFLSCYRTAKERGYGLKDKGQFQQEGYIFGVSGAAGFYRKDMLEDIKEDQDYFDSNFHFFYEDLDVSWRARRAGWKAYYIPKAIGYHVRGGSVRNKYGINKPYARRYLSEKLHLDLLKNRYMTIIKNESCLDFLRHLPCMFLYDLVLWSYILIFRTPLIKNFFSQGRYLRTAYEKRRFYRRRIKERIFFQKTKNT